jgi:DNA-binding NtrC family response regulator
MMSERYSPKTEEAIPFGLEPGKSVQRGPQSKETVLLIEDDEFVGALLGEMLQRLGYSVVTVGGGREALAILRRKSKPCHVVVSDLVLSDIEGHQVAQQIRELQPETKILLISGYGASDLMQGYETLPNGIAFLQKPFRASQLATKLRELLRQ